MTPDLDATISRLRAMLKDDREDWVPDELLAESFKDAMPIIDALQAEIARLLQAHMEAGFRAGELTAKLLDSDAALYKCWEKIAEKNGLIDELQAKLLDVERSAPYALNAPAGRRSPRARRRRSP